MCDNKEISITLVHIVPAAAAKQVVLTFYSFLGVNSEIEEYPPLDYVLFLDVVLKGELK